MIVPGAANPMLWGGDPCERYQIRRSVRFNAPDGAYLTRTPPAGNQTTWTWAGWVKRSSVGDVLSLFDQYTDANNYAGLQFGDALQFAVTKAGVTGINVLSAAVFRDVAAHAHVVVAVNTGDATPANRVRLWVNGVQVTAFASAAYPAQNEAVLFNSATAHCIGRNTRYGYYANGYLSDIHFIDGQALDASAFGFFCPATGQWRPKAYIGTYGTNGFRLDFSDNSAATSSALGKDRSGNNNDWTPVNISVAVGAGNDSLEDTTSNNFCTLNPLDYVSAAGSMAASNGNLDFQGSGSLDTTMGTTFLLSSGKWYWETQLFGTVSPTTSGQGHHVGLIRVDMGAAYYYRSKDGSPFAAPAAVNDIIGLAADIDAGTLQVFKNGVSLGTIALAPGTAYKVANYYWGSTAAEGTGFTNNFGQRPFAYAPPAGFKALCTRNLPAPAIKRPQQYFDALLYTGNGAARSIGGLEFAPDLVWFKARSFARSHRLFDSQRGVGKYIVSNVTNAETTDAQSLTAFNSDGFALGTSAEVNSNGESIVAWCWKKGVTPGFDVVTYAGNGANRVIPHSLGAKPAFMVIKRLDAGTTDWIVYHAKRGADRWLGLNLTSAENVLATVFNNTDPDSANFYLGTADGVNAAGGSYVAYLWADVPGIARANQYTGNGSSDGPFVHCGFQPKFVLWKRADAAGSWRLYDDTRNPNNPMDLFLHPNLSNAEASAAYVDFLANGFKMRTTDVADNASGGTYIFAAFAEFPFKYANAR